MKYCKHCESKNISDKPASSNSKSEKVPFSFNHFHCSVLKRIYWELRVVQIQWEEVSWVTEKGKLCVTRAIQPSNTPTTCWSCHTPYPPFSPTALTESRLLFKANFDRSRNQLTVNTDKRWNHTEERKERPTKIQATKILGLVGSGQNYHKSTVLSAWSGVSVLAWLCK